MTSKQHKSRNMGKASQPLFLRFADLRAAGYVNNRTTLGRWIDKYNFPPGVLLGPNLRCWTKIEIEAWLAERRRLTTLADAVREAEDSREAVDK